MRQNKTFISLKAGKMYMLPKGSSWRSVVTTPSVMCVDIVSYIKPEIPFVFLERRTKHSWAKVLTNEGLVGWVEFSVYAGPRFVEATYTKEKEDNT